MLIPVILYGNNEMIDKEEIKMKKSVILGLVLVIALPLLALGCQKAQSATLPPTTPTESVPAYHGGEEAKTIEITTDDFAAQNSITKDIEVIRPGSLIVSLGANPTTGFQWGENATIQDTSVVVQASYQFVEPEQTGEPIVGAPGKSVWVFDSKNPGTTTIGFSYDRPWEGGEKGQWTLTINVTVK
jgi:inhibitor of cysteine peptidase